MKKIIFTVTSDPNYDQRMQRIATTLQQHGFDVTLVGVQRENSHPLSAQLFKQKRLKPLLKKGFLFYISYNVQLLFYLFRSKADILGAIDLDTIIPVYLISILKGKKRIFDAHEYFTELKEVKTRKRIYKIWSFIEHFFLPKFILGYTVSQSIAEAFKNKYDLEYKVIRNVPLREGLQYAPITKIPKKILYQGAVNEGRGFEYLVPAMKNIDAVLDIYGDGNFVNQLKLLIKKHGIEHKINYKGSLFPAQLHQQTPNYLLGVNLVENIGLNQFYSLANKFFDYIQAGIPQITMAYPEYKRINNEYEVAVLLNNLNAKEIAEGINELLNNKTYYDKLQANCKKAALYLNWEYEQKKLLEIYQSFT